MLSSLPCFYAFCWSAIPTSCYTFNVFLFLFMSLFSSRCMLELKFSIYYRAASISNSAILRNNYISLLSDSCACVHVNKRCHCKGSHSSSVSGKKQWAGALLSEKCCCFVLNHCERVTQIWTSPSEEEEEEERCTIHSVALVQCMRLPTASVLQQQNNWAEHLLRHTQICHMYML